MAVRVARASESELEVARAIRRTVFVEEQSVPAEVEVDGLDGSAEHYLARLGPLPVATARCRQTAKGWKIERVAVLGTQRGLGVGKALVGFILADVLAKTPPQTPIYVHAQAGALGFWERAGFIAEGPTFEEGGITHRWMRFARST